MSHENLIMQPYPLWAAVLRRGQREPWAGPVVGWVRDGPVWTHAESMRPVIASGPGTVVPPADAVVGYSSAPIDGPTMREFLTAARHAQVNPGGSG